MKNKFPIIAVFFLVFMECKTVTKIDANSSEQRLAGEWVLEKISQQDQNLEELYTRGVPFINFDPKQNIISGNNGCNSFSGKLKVKENKIDFKEPMISTRIYCEGIGETIFMQNLAKTEMFSISKDGKILQLIEGEVSLMRFIKK